jgi:hypothetical protein
MNKQNWLFIYSLYKTKAGYFKKINEDLLLNKDIFCIKNKGKPEPPKYPSPDDCCQSGCIDCVYVIYDDLYCKYEEEMVKWRLENSEDSEFGDFN